VTITADELREGVRRFAAALDEVRSSEQVQ